jgi:hypothetical protein
MILITTSHLNTVMAAGDFHFVGEITQLAEAATLECA